MQDESKAAKIVRRFESLYNFRANWDNQFQQISDYIMPRRGDFNATLTEGINRQNKIYDSTATQAAENLASALGGFLVSPSERWFNLDTEDQSLSQNFEIRMWLQYVTDLIYAVCANPKAAFYSHAHEFFIDIVTFGTSVFSCIEELEDYPLSFKTINLSECYIDKNSYGEIDTMFRCFRFDSRQIMQQFGESLAPDLTAELIENIEKNKTTQYEIIHAVYPREYYDKNKIDKYNKKYMSCYVWRERKALLSEGGYDEFPYMVARWYVLNSEIYGRSPGMTVLPDVKSLQEMEKSVLKAAQKTVDPPLMVPDDGFLAPIDTRPSKINYYRSGTQDKIEPMMFGSNFQIATEQQEAKRRNIRAAFFADILQESKQVEMTRYESSQREEARMRLLAPQLGRLHNEFLGKLINRIYKVLKRKGLIPPVSSELQGGIKISYVSPLARAQRGTQLNYMNMYSEQIIKLAQVYPDILDAINPQRYHEYMGYLMNTPMKILNTPEEIQAKQEQRQQQQEAATQMNMLEQGSKAVGNLAKVIPMGDKRGSAQQG